MINAEILIAQWKGKRPPAVVPFDLPAEMLPGKNLGWPKVLTMLPGSGLLTLCDWIHKEPAANGDAWVSPAV